MSLKVLLLVVTLASSVEAAQYDVEYYLRTETLNHWYSDGDYLFLLAAPQYGGYITVYVHDYNWIYLGHYGAAMVPDTMPVIAFPMGTNIAGARMIQTPEAETWILLIISLTVVCAYTAWQKERNSVRK